MEDFEGEKRHICKICSKSCDSGRALGGHMRAHLTALSSGKKVEKEKGTIRTGSGRGDDDDQERGNSYSDDMDQKTSYELRENPKKSWKVSVESENDCPQVQTVISCEECGMEFPSMKARWCHMRDHSSKKSKTDAQCKDCGKLFNTLKAMYGHMKIHSHKRKATDKSSDLETLVGFRKKRSRIQYKRAKVATFFDLEREAAEGLVMLSMAVIDCSESYGDSAYVEESESFHSIGIVSESCDRPENKNASEDLDAAVEIERVSDAFEQILERDSPETLNIFQEESQCVEGAEILTADNGINCNLVLQLLCENQT